LAHFQAAIVAKTYDNLVRELDALDNGVQAGRLAIRVTFHAATRIGIVDTSLQKKEETLSWHGQAVEVRYEEHSNPGFIPNLYPKKQLALFSEMFLL